MNDKLKLSDNLTGWFWNKPKIIALNKSTYVSRIVHLSCDPVRAGGQWRSYGRVACEKLLSTANFLPSRPSFQSKTPNTKPGVGISKDN